MKYLKLYEGFNNEYKVALQKLNLNLNLNLNYLSSKFVKKLDIFKKQI
jgi:hypothetical protein